jgi:hypothetical protein
MKIRLGIAFKDFACWLMNTSSVGLNVAGYTTAQVLRENGVDVSVFPVRDNVDLVHAIDKYNENHPDPLTHLVICAPWLTPHDLKSIAHNYKNMKIVALSHSNVGFLQADYQGLHNIRGYQKLEHHHKNLKVGGNSEKFVDWMETAYGRHVTYLPNLYPVSTPMLSKQWNRSVPLKIGAFGAVRPYKNFMTAAAAALLIHRETGMPVEFHMSAGAEGDSGMIIPAIQAMLEHTGVNLVTHNWCYWTDFIKLVSSMDLMIQPSYTESFNLITADGVMSGVQSVVSTAITWAPDGWKADSDNANEVAEVGMELLMSAPNYDGYKALTKSNKHGIQYWYQFLGIQPETKWNKFIKRIGVK